MNMKNSYYHFFSEGSVINQVICAVLINLPLFAYGASIGWMSPMTVLLQSDNSPSGRRLSDAEISWMAAVAYMVSVPVNMCMGYLGDKIGRKLSLYIISISALGCWIVKLSSYDTWAFIFARALVGVTMSSYISCPLYTKEISDNNIRGMLGSLLVVFHTSGNLFLYIIGDIVSYNTVLWICLSLPVLHMVLFTMMPESPSFLVKKGKLEEATKVIAWLKCRQENDVVVQNELNFLKREKEKDDETNRFALGEIFTNKILFRAFRIAMVVSLAREMCGVVPVTNFAADIFLTASGGAKSVLSANQQAILLGTVQVVGSILGSSVVERAGRKPVLFITSLVSGLSMCTLATWFLARLLEFHFPNWLPIVCLCLCIFCDSFGLQPVSVVIIGEIFSFKYRSSVIATAMAAASTACFIQLLSFKPLATAVGVHVAFYSFGFICLAAALYTILVIPETKQKSVDEIYEHLKTKKERALDEKIAQIDEEKKNISVL